MGKNTDLVRRLNEILYSKILCRVKAPYKYAMACPLVCLPTPSSSSWSGAAPDPSLTPSGIERKELIPEMNRGWDMQCAKPWAKDPAMNSELGPCHLKATEAIRCGKDKKNNCFSVKGGVISESGPYLLSASQAIVKRCQVNWNRNNKKETGGPAWEAYPAWEEVKNKHCSLWWDQIDRRSLLTQSLAGHGEKIGCSI